MAAHALPGELGAAVGQVGAEAKARGVDGTTQRRDGDELHRLAHRGHRRRQLVALLDADRREGGVDVGGRLGEALRKVKDLPRVCGAALLVLVLLVLVLLVWHC